MDHVTSLYATPNTPSDWDETVLAMFLTLPPRALVKHNLSFCSKKFQSASIFVSLSQNTSRSDSRRQLRRGASCR